MAVLRSLVTTLGLNSAQFRSGLTQAQQSFSRFREALANGAKAIGTAMAAMAGAAALALKQTYSDLDRIRRQAEMVGVSAGKFHQYAASARRAGTDLEQFSDTLKELNTRITDAAKTDAGVLVDFFKQIGQSAKDWANLDVDEQFRRFTVELQKMSDSDARFYLNEINDSAAILFETLRNGEFLRLADEAERLKMSLTTGQFELVRQARSEMINLSSTVMAIWEQVAAAVAPVVTSISRGIRQWINDQAGAAGGFRQLGVIIAETVLRSVVNVAKTLQDTFNSTYISAEKLAAMVGKTLSPEREAQKRHLEQLRSEYAQLSDQITKIKWNGDTPSHYEQLGTPEQIERFSVLSSLIQDIQTQVSTPFNFAAGFETSVDGIIAKIKDAQIEMPEPVRKLGAVAIPTTQAQSVKDTSEDDAARLKDQLQDRLDALRQSYTSEKELLNQKIVNEQTLLNEALSRKLIADQDYLTLSASMHQQYNEQLLEMDRQRALEQGDLLETLKEHFQVTASTYTQVWTSALESVTGGIGDSVAGAIVDGENLRDSMINVGKSVARAMISSLVQIGAQRAALWVAEKALGAAGGAAMTTAVTGQALAGVNLAALNAFASTAAIPITGPAMAPAAAAAAVAATTPMATAAITAATSTIAGARALGGEVLAGSTYLVGERGPELFQAGASGQITSNQNLSAALKGNDKGSGVQSITLSPQIVVEGGASQSNDQFFAENIAQQVFSMLMQDANTGGIFSRALGAR